MSVERKVQVSAVSRTLRWAYSSFTYCCGWLKRGFDSGRVVNATLGVESAVGGRRWLGVMGLGRRDGGATVGVGSAVDGGSAVGGGHLVLGNGRELDLYGQCALGPTWRAGLQVLIK